MNRDPDRPSLALLSAPRHLARGSWLPVADSAGEPPHYRAPPVDATAKRAIAARPVVGVRMLVMSADTDPDLLRQYAADHRPLPDPLSAAAEQMAT
jgi:hypothetical protein